MAYIDNVTSILQIQPDGLPTFVRLSQNENGRNLYFQLAGNEIDIPANATITISGTKPDGTVYSGTGSISDNVILIPEMIQMTAVAGYWDAKVKIISGGNTIATGRIRFVIDADTVDPDAVPSDSELEGLVAEAQQYAETARTEAYGSPLTAQTAAGMTDHTRVYVYTGSETGYTAGHWYFWNGSAWTDGGIYNSTAVNTDTTLTLAGVAADAKATGDAIEAARVAIDDTLTNEGEAADAAAVGSEIGGLKEDLDIIEGDLSEALIISETTKSESHADVPSVKSIEFFGNEKAFTTARYVDGINIMPDLTVDKTVNDVHIEAEGHFITYNGESGSSHTSTTMGIYDTPTYPAGDYKFVIDMSQTVKGRSRTTLRLYDAANPGQYTNVIYTWFTKSYIGTFTAPYAFNRIYLSLSVDDDTDYDNFKTWVGVYPAPCSIVDTELIVPENGSADYSDGDFSGIAKIDTMQHESIVTHINNTKDYVDNHIPDIKAYWTEEIYALPEKFGAVGDGVTDDYQALTACFSYAKTFGKAVRGFKNYKISDSLVIDWQNADVYLRMVAYTGNNAALELQNSGVEFGFHEITSAGVGIIFGYNTGKTAYARRCQIIGNNLTSDGNCIVIKEKTLYNSCQIRNLSSTNNNCIVFEDPETSDSFRGGEYVFRDCSCACTKGYVGININSSKLYNFTIEGNCKYGFLNPLSSDFIGCRHREQTDRMQYRILQGRDYDNGPLFVFTQTPNKGNEGIKWIAQDPIPYYAVDLSGIQDNYDQISNSSDWLAIGYNGIDFGVSIRGMDVRAYDYIGEKMFFIGNHKVYVPPYRKKYTLLRDEYDMTLYESGTDADIAEAYTIGGWATDFITGVAHTDYYFNGSFSAVGYNDLTFTQVDGKTVTVYDKLGNILFDGTNAGNGTWRLTCAVDRNSVGRNASGTSWWIYDGTNEVWTVEKIA